MRLSLRLILIALLIVAVAPSFVIPKYLGHGAELLNGKIPSTEESNTFQDGYRLERGGDLEGALAKYRAAAKSRLAEVHNLSERAVIRVNTNLNRLGTWYPDLRTLRAWSQLIRVPVLITVLLIAFIVIVHYSNRPRGTEIRRFSVIPEYDSNVAIKFDRLLREEIARVARVYRSDQYRRIGIAVAISDPEADRELADLESRAIAAIRQGEQKAMIGFWLSELIRNLQNIGFRPEYVLSGTVIMRQGEATAHAQLARAGSSKITSVFEASSSEFASVKIPIPLSLPRKGSKTIAPQTLYAPRDLREDAQQLSDLAAVLACKFCARTDIASAQMRLTSWQTVYHFGRALNTLESWK